jgi:hypothetical protein
MKNDLAHSHFISHSHFFFTCWSWESARRPENWLRLFHIPPLKIIDLALPRSLILPVTRSLILIMLIFLLLILMKLILNCWSSSRSTRARSTFSRSNEKGARRRQFFFKNRFHIRYARSHTILSKTHYSRGWIEPRGAAHWPRIPLYSFHTHTNRTRYRSYSTDSFFHPSFLFVVRCRYVNSITHKRKYAILMRIFSRFFILSVARSNTSSQW